MTPIESTRFNNALREQFNDYEVKIVKSILSGEGNLNQEDIIRTSNEGILLLRKLGWLFKVKKVFKNSGLHLLSQNQTII